MKFIVILFLLFTSIYTLAQQSDSQLAYTYYQAKEYDKAEATLKKNPNNDIGYEPKLKKTMSAYYETEGDNRDLEKMGRPENLLCKRQFQEDFPRQDSLTVGSLDAESLGLAVPTVLGGTDALLMSKELQTELQHLATSIIINVGMVVSGIGEWVLTGQRTYRAVSPPP